MKVGFIQMSIELLDIKKNVDNAIKLMEKNEASLIVLPELFNTGYNFKNKKEVLDVSENIPDGYTTKTLKDFTEDTNKTIVFGLSEKTEKGLYNSLAVVSKGEYIGKYRKIHLFFDEKNYFLPGDLGFKIFEVEGIKIGTIICFDWFFPESTRTLSLMGADILCHPANLVMPYCPEAMKTICLQNRVYSITSNRIGEERGLKFIGQSQIVGPDGKIIFRASEAKQESYEVEVDPLIARDKNLNPKNNIFNDRKPEFYKII
ncbi:MAG: C-N hydrolase family amidase [Candidatus Methanofastidiosum methylothiophilum]|uniref:C-N hydrolase family amidase n=1 Tax=Candidatus Methanofastidiosum methylothiophilum TaxID=1705564 RepID=A0A150IZA7_9EURY|nr:MAG: C-N hydrolase family amidase [Candidatus Methanofastidiosum methylthiophilus]KYC47608.1 MAG: C-N hydrolase family amidase [Candidatus Methanofastidiosum methylthiophilus]KYC50225.1 MAG: C-N hydrolase family amidase [Candidatus Methanofastidiosum methylthiophilus]